MEAVTQVLLDLSDLTGSPTPVLLEDFLAENPDLDPGEVLELQGLEEGQAVHLGIGGGAVLVRRCSSGA